MKYKTITNIKKLFEFEKILSEYLIKGWKIDKMEWNNQEPTTILYKEE